MERLFKHTIKVISVVAPCAKSTAPAITANVPLEVTSCIYSGKIAQVVVFEWEVRIKKSLD